MRYKIIVAALLGHVFIWYDYSLYGNYISILAKLFFPENIEIVGAFSAFAMGFLSRPIGGVIFGYIGEKYGRKVTLVWTMILTALSTALIGLLPTYDQVGIIAPILLITLRLIQGIAFGGELGGAITFLLESFATNNNRGLIGSTVQCATASGILLAILVSSISAFFIADPMITWRIPFLIGGVIALISFYIRYKVEEPELFIQHDNSSIKIKYYFQHIIEALTNYKKSALLVIILEVVGGSSFYMLNVFITSMQGLGQGHSIKLSFTLLTFNMIFFAATAVISGFLSDKVGRKIMFIISAIIFFCFSYPAFYLFSIDNIPIKIITSILWSINLGIFYGPFATTISELFTVKVRHTAISFLISSASAIFVGTTPLISTLLIHITGNQYSPTFYLMLLSLISIIIVSYLMPKLHTQHLK